MAVDVLLVGAQSNSYLVRVRVFEDYFATFRHRGYVVVNFPWHDLGGPGSIVGYIADPMDVKEEFWFADTFDDDAKTSFHKRTTPLAPTRTSTAMLKEYVSAAADGMEKHYGSKFEPAVLASEIYPKRKQTDKEVGHKEFLVVPRALPPLAFDDKWMGDAIVVESSPTIDAEKVDVEDVPWSPGSHHFHGGVGRTFCGFVLPSLKHYTMSTWEGAYAAGQNHSVTIVIAVSSIEERFDIPTVPKLYVGGVTVENPARVPGKVVGRHVRPQTVRVGAVQAHRFVSREAELRQIQVAAWFPVRRSEIQRGHRPSDVHAMPRLRLRRRARRG